MTGFQNGKVLISVRALPEGGAANDAVIQVLSDALKIAKTQITLKRGHKSREKTVEISGLEAETVLKILAPRAPSRDSS